MFYASQVIFQCFLTGKFCGSKAILPIDMATNFSSFFHGKILPIIYNFLHSVPARPHCKKAAESPGGDASFCRTRYMSWAGKRMQLYNPHRCQYHILRNQPDAGAPVIFLSQYFTVCIMSAS